MLTEIAVIINISLTAEARLHLRWLHELTSYSIFYGSRPFFSQGVSVKSRSLMVALFPDWCKYEFSGLYTAFIRSLCKVTCFNLQLLSEYVGGGTLFTWLQHHVPMPLDMLRHYTKEILDGLAYLHRNAVVHEDLRVNILLFCLFCIWLDGKMHLPIIMSLRKSLLSFSRAFTCRLTKMNLATARTLHAACPVVT